MKNGPIKFLVIMGVLGALVGLAFWQMGFFQASTEGLRVYHVTCDVVAQGEIPNQLYCQDLPQLGIIEIPSQ